MKKLLSIALALVMLCSFSVSALAANTTTLTTTVPAATYTLNIPEDQEIPFGAENTDIGSITVTEASGFADGKNLNVTLTYGEFICEDVTTTIPFTVIGSRESSNGSENITLPSASTITFMGQADGTLYQYHQFKYGGYASPLDADIYYVSILSEDWGKALAGDYTATITFTAEVVVEE